MESPSKKTYTSSSLEHQIQEASFENMLLKFEMLHKLRTFIENQNSWSENYHDLSEISMNRLIDFEQV